MKYLYNKIKNRIWENVSRDTNINHDNIDRIYQQVDNVLHIPVASAYVQMLSEKFIKDHISEKIQMVSFNSDDYIVNEGESKGYAMLGCVLFFCGIGIFSILSYIIHLFVL